MELFILLVGLFVCLFVCTYTVPLQTDQEAGKAKSTKIFVTKSCCQSVNSVVNLRTRTRRELKLVPSLSDQLPSSCSPVCRENECCVDVQLSLGVFLQLVCLCCVSLCIDIHFGVSLSESTASLNFWNWLLYALQDEV